MEIHLEPEQEDLLRLLVEAWRSSPSDGRDSFVLVPPTHNEPQSQWTLRHTGLEDGSQFVHDSPLRALEHEGLIARRDEASDWARIDVTSRGFRRYDDMREEQRAAEAVFANVETMLGSELPELHEEFRKGLLQKIAELGAGGNAFSTAVISSAGELGQEAIRRIGMAVIEAWTKALRAFSAPVDANAVRQAAVEILEEQAHEVTVGVNTLTQNVRKRLNKGREIDLRPALYQTDKKIRAELDLVLAQRERDELVVEVPTEVPASGIGTVPKVFVCYRRDDSAYPAQQIYDKLASHFGRESVVFDVETIPLGTDFREYLTEQVCQCDVLLAVIGDRWVKLLNDRLDDPKDFVRVEIEAALEAQIKIVPVLVGRALVPSEEDLPTHLRSLPYSNAAEVRAGRDLQAHLQRLMNGLDDLFKKQADAILGPPSSQAEAASEKVLPVALEADRGGTKTVMAPTSADEKRSVEHLRARTGEMHEAIMSHGAPLDGEDLEYVLERFRELREAGGRFGHHRDLQEAIRALDNRDGWMLRFKRLDQGPQRFFGSAEEETEARREAEAAYRAFVDACNDLLSRPAARTDVEPEPTEKQERHQGRLRATSGQRIEYEWMHVGDGIRITCLSDNWPPRIDLSMGFPQAVTRVVAQVNDEGEDKGYIPTPGQHVLLRIHRHLESGDRLHIKAEGKVDSVNLGWAV